MLEVVYADNGLAVSALGEHRSTHLNILSANVSWNYRQCLVGANKRR